MAQLAQQESTWLDRHLFEEAENNFHSHVAKGTIKDYKPFNSHHRPRYQSHKGSLAGEVAKAREHIRNTLNGFDSSTCVPSCEAINNKVEALEKQVLDLTSRLEALEKFCKASCKSSVCEPSKTPTSATIANNKDDDDDDFELFGSDDEEDEEAEKLKQERLAAYAAKKEKKPALVAKSNVIFDVKPWDDETDMKKLEECVRSVTMDGLLWGASKLVPLAYSIKKLQITCVIEDDKVSTEELEEKITAFEDYIQSVDIAAFNKI